MVNPPINSNPNKTGISTALRSSLIVITVAFITTELFVLVSGGKYPLRASDLSKDAILTAVNRERSIRNLVTLSTNGSLATAGQQKADDMITRKYFSHVDPDGNYIWGKITAAGYTPYTQLGENLAIDFYDTESLVAAWMNSPTHRANILQEGFRDQGVGLAFGDSGLGQYYSSIANTFGTLVTKKQTAAAAPAPSTTTAPAPAKTTSATKTTAQTPTTPPPPAPKTAEPVKSVEQTTPPQTLAVVTENQTPSFAVPVKSSTTTSPAPEANTTTDKALVGNSALSSGKTLYEKNRILILGFAILLLFYLITDAKNLKVKDTVFLDKKINNVVVLGLAIVVIAVMYWI